MVNNTLLRPYLSWGYLKWGQVDSIRACLAFSLAIRFFSAFWATILHSSHPSSTLASVQVKCPQAKVRRPCSPVLRRRQRQTTIVTKTSESPPSLLPRTQTTRTPKEQQNRKAFPGAGFTYPLNPTRVGVGNGSRQPTHSFQPAPSLRAWTPKNALEPR